MHEASITQALIEQAREFVPKGMRLVLCKIQIGRLEHLDAEIMSQMWQGMIEDAGMAGAELEIEFVGVRVRCTGCDAEFEPEDPAVMRCPACGSARPDVLEGTGVVLASLEVEEVE